MTKKKTLLDEAQETLMECAESIDLCVIMFKVGSAIGLIERYKQEEK